MPSSLERCDHVRHRHAPPRLVQQHLCSVDDPTHRERCTAQQCACLFRLVLVMVVFVKLLAVPCKVSLNWDYGVTGPMSVRETVSAERRWQCVSVTVCVDWWA